MHSALSMSPDRSIRAAYVSAWEQAAKIALKEFDDAMTMIGGCGNHGCMIKAPTGMGTNAGCRCWMDKMVAQRAIIAMRRLRKALDTIEPIAK